MKVCIASDHAGLELKTSLVAYLRDELSCEVEDFGAHALAPEDDYPELITPCARAVAAEREALGIVIGGSGQGEAMAANRVPGARCALFYGTAAAHGTLDAEGTVAASGYDIVRLARSHNDANLLSLGARFVTLSQAKEAVRAFIETPFTGGERHSRRIAQLG